MDMPTMREVNRLADERAGLRAVAEALWPYRDRFYASARAARPGSDGSKDDPEVTVIDLEVDIFQVVGALVVVAALAYFGFSLVRGLLPQPQDYQMEQAALPTYSLKSSPAASQGAAGAPMYSLGGGPQGLEPG
ncbi:unnamed protein product [Prorocentrum cordatum]|uniref:Uncharacterized protein n=1 Tax=Prorocentrum cordatum TaxID=2364126 RepID=A0ABN9U754_9DINO|nr:unnamed protein product [Polarella glacialis]